MNIANIPNDDNMYHPQCHIINWNSFNHAEQHKFSILSMNIRSMHNKFSEFKAHLSSSKINFTFIVLTETWASESNDIGFDIEGYKCLSLYRGNNQRGGGIKIYYLENLAVSTIDEETGIFNYCEKYFIQTTISGMGKINIVAIYRPLVQT